MNDQIAQTCHALLDNSAAQYPERPFIIDRGKEATFEAVQAESHKIAARLGSLGIIKGDRVALLATPSRFFVECFYGITRTGAIAVPLNPGLSGSELQEILNDCAARVVIFDADQTRHRNAKDIPSLIERILLEDTGETTATIDPRYQGLASDSSEAPTVALTAEDPALIVYNPSDAGATLGLVFSHGNIVANTTCLVETLQLSANDRALMVLPLHGAYGLSVLNAHAAASASVVIGHNLDSPQEAVNAFDEWGCTGLSGLPSSFSTLLHQTDMAQREMATLRYATLAGSEMTSALTQELMNVFDGRDLFILYGAPQATAWLSYLAPSMLADGLGSVGRAMPEVTLKVRGPDGTELGQGESGEIFARGPGVTLGYWEEPEATAEILDERGLRTGDVGYLDKQGMLHLVDRKPTT